MSRYFIEQAPNRYYQAIELGAAKARARRLSKGRDDGVYLIAEQFDPEQRDWVQSGSIAYYSGAQDAREGIFASSQS